MSGYLRYPHLHGDLLTFVAADDVWLAPAQGGRAWRLTDHQTPARTPRFSPDGQHVAWASSRFGHWELLVMPVAGGEPHRLTYWGGSAITVLGWTFDGRVLVASSAGEHNLRALMVKAVGLDGSVERLPYGPVSGVAVHPDGAVAVATPVSREPAAWKRYRGGTAAKLWLDPAADGSWQRLLPEVTASLVSPSWIGDRLLFASDLEAQLPGTADGQANLYSLSATGDDLARHTHHTVQEGYVRDPTTDGERIVYHCRGGLFAMTSLEAAPERLDVVLGSAAVGRAPRLLDPTRDLETVRPDHGADRSVVGWRGNVFTLSHREGPARALAAEPSVRSREPRVLGDTGSAVWVSDAQGADSLHVGALDGTGEIRTLAAGALGRVLSLKCSPAGDRVAVVSHDGRISTVTVADGEVTEVGHSTNGEAGGLTFSPDGTSLVWGEPVGLHGSHDRLMLSDLTAPGSAAVALTSGRFRDYSTSFTADGRYLAFLSARTFDPSYDSHVFNLGFASSVRPYLVGLSATTPAPFGPSADGWRLSDAPKESAADADGDATPTTDPIDVEGFEERIVAFPVPAGSYRSLRAVAGGVTWIHEVAGQGVLGSGRAGVDGDEPTDTLEAYVFAEREVRTLLDAVDSYAVSGDGKRLVTRHQKKVLVIGATKPTKAADDPARVTVDLTRLRHELDPVAEWVQMFDENATIMRDHYWRADMDGLDWDAAVAHYRPLVPTLASHDDLVDLLWETVAELNTSHAYVNPVTPLGDPKRKIGLLGADFRRDTDGHWVIDHIVPGESSDPKARSPLRAAGVGAQVGDAVVAVDGRPVDGAFGPAAALAGAADRPVELTLRPADGGEERRVVVVPIPDEETLRYQEWVRGRAAYVRDVTGGRLGYLHIPDMMSVGWAQIHRDIEDATAAEGLIVDVRFNRGGHTSQLVIERLSRKVLGWTTARNLSQAGDYPAQSTRGPVVFVANQWSGSDGDIVNAAAQALKLGPVVGERTWGGVVGIDGRYALVDGTRITQPRFAFWLTGYGWGVENHGVDPDIEVVMSPGDWHRPGDPQLDRAITEALDRLAVTPAAEPPVLPPARIRRG